MKKYLILMLLSLVSLAQAQLIQPDSVRVYWLNNNRIAVKNQNSAPKDYAPSQVSVSDNNGAVRVTIDRSSRNFLPGKFGRSSGVSWHPSSSTAAVAAYQASIPSSGGSDDTTQLATRSYVNTKAASLSNTATAQAATIATHTGQISSLSTTAGSGQASQALNLTKAGRVLIPQFKTASKFYNQGAALSSTLFAIHATGVGLVSSASGSVASGYIPLAEEVDARKATRTDFLLNWDMSDASASVTVGLGNNTAGGYMITLTNSGGNLVTTFPSGATKTQAMTGTFSLCVSFATANMGITASVHVLGNPTPLATTSNIYRVPVWEYALATKNQLWQMYFANNSTVCRIVGAFHNASSWDGDVTAQLLTRTMILHSSGFVGWNGGNNRENDSYVIIPERTNYTTPIRVVNFQHQNAGSYTNLIDVTTLDNGETARQILLNGNILMSSNGGLGTATKETDSWGSPQALDKANALYQTVATNVHNVGKETLFGASMGGGVQLNYLRQYSSRIANVILSCPALDFEETGTNSIQTQFASIIRRAYAPWYIATATTTADPQSDLTGWRQVSSPGAQPHLGVRLATATIIPSAVSNSNVVVPTTTPNGTTIKYLLLPGDQLYFKFAGVSRFYALSFSGNANVQLDAPLTTIANEQVSIIRQGVQPAYEYNWANRSFTEWSAGSTGAGLFVWRGSANPTIDIMPHNPTRYYDLYAELNIPIHIYYSSQTNDGILNRAPIDSFIAGVNTQAGKTLVTSTVVSVASHLAATTFNATDTVARINAN